MDRKKKMPFRNRHPNFPLYLSIIAACCSVAALVLTLK